MPAAAIGGATATLKGPTGRASRTRALPCAPPLSTQQPESCQPTRHAGRWRRRLERPRAGAGTLLLDALSGGRRTPWTDTVPAVAAAPSSSSQRPQPAGCSWVRAARPSGPSADVRRGGSDSSGGVSGGLTTGHQSSARVCGLCASKLIAVSGPCADRPLPAAFRPLSLPSSQSVASHRLWRVSAASPRRPPW